MLSFGSVQICLDWIPKLNHIVIFDLSLRNERLETPARLDLVGLQLSNGFQQQVLVLRVDLPELQVVLFLEQWFLRTHHHLLEQVDPVLAQQEAHALVHELVVRICDQERHFALILHVFQ